MIVERIMKIIEYKGINKSLFYKETGLSNGFLDKVKDVGSSKIEHILKTYPEINPIWLITGHGDMLKSDVSLEFKPDIYAMLQDHSERLAKIELDIAKNEKPPK